jgi:hypothetical protein
MTLEVWYKADIQNALWAAEHAGTATLKAAGSGSDVYAAGYWMGYHAALTTLALAFGVLSAGSRATDMSVPSGDMSLLHGGEAALAVVGEEA